MLPRFNPWLSLSNSRENKYVLYASLVHQAYITRRQNLTFLPVRGEILADQVCRLAYYRLCKSDPQRQDEPSRLVFQARHAIMNILHSAGHSSADINKPSSNTRVYLVHMSLLVPVHPSPIITVQRAGSLQ